MTIDANLGRLTWNPGIPNIGTYLITVVVTNSGGLQATQSYNLIVAADTQAPSVIIRTVPAGGRRDIGADNSANEVTGGPIDSRDDRRAGPAYPRIGVESLPRHDSLAACGTSADVGRSTLGFSGEWAG
jgi:hypothetical protein